MSYSSVREPRWVDRAHTAIECMVKFDDFVKELPFVANPTDCEAHGREIFAKCVAGEFGAIKEFSAGCQPAVHEVKMVDSSQILDRLHPLLPRWIEESNIENSQGTLRGIILVGASIIDKMLGEILVAFLVDGQSDKVFSQSETLFGEFSSRNKACLALGLISCDEYAACEAIRHIRNYAAHELILNGKESVLLEKKPLNQLRKLHEQFHKDLYHFPDKEPEKLVKQIYHGSVGFIVMKLNTRWISAGAQKRTAF
nr:hypothetical protein [uncultured Cohaesibacter sp.]